MPKLLIAPLFGDKRGTLGSIDGILPFEIKRVFYIFNATETRGGHRHKKTWQALFCVSGQCEIYWNNGKVEDRVLLDSPGKILILEPDDWHTMENFSQDAVLLVLASASYDRSDYIDEPYPSRS